MLFKARRRRKAGFEIPAARVLLAAISFLPTLPRCVYVCSALRRLTTRVYERMWI